MKITVFETGEAKCIADFDGERITLTQEIYGYGEIDSITLYEDELDKLYKSIKSKD
ncbi:hypothetical protein [Aquibacillus saliphilus]|uniref:hypothetical protein n=1 Tax=Aquibacillus saliphilus TaxID=1909422 RepID=UPI001CF071A0|nr:hypothetical protein [Aquibacillus saliphilus]